MKRLLLTYFLLSIGCSPYLFAQEQTEVIDTTDKKLSLTVLPIVYVTPETGLALGAGGSLAFRIKDSKHASSLLLGGVYTLRKQLLTYLSYQIYFKADKYRLQGEAGYYDYVYEYYGIGNLPGEREFYDANYPRIRVSFTKSLNPQLYAGLTSKFDWFKTSNFDPLGELVVKQPSGYQGGTVALVGPIVQWDTRDNVYWSQKGHYVEARYMWSNDAWGADYNFGLWQLDIRKFFPIGKQVLAFQFYQQIVDGDVPFYQYAQLGGPKLLRGYYEGYLRDNIFMSSQVAWRGPLFWRMGFSVFAGIGTTSDRWKSILQKTYWPSYGLGIRFALVPEERINLRLDYAFGRDNSAFYLTFIEAF